MASGPNPLRPYYVPPSPNSLPAPSPPAPPAPPPQFSTPVIRPASTESVLPSLSYDDYDFSNDSLTDALRAKLQSGFLQYSTHLIHQPFDVARILLQVRVASRRDRRKFVLQDNPSERAEFDIEDDDEVNDSDDDDDDPPYFTDSNNIALQREKPKRKSRKLTDRAGYVVENQLAADGELPAHQLLLRDPNSIFGCMKSVWEKEGLRGVWKGNNCGFIYSILFSALQPWTQSLLGAIFSVPDLDPLAMADSDSPFLGLAITTASYAITSLALSPLDIARIKLILQPITSKPRGLWPTLKSLPTGYTCPQNLLLPTTLYGILDPLFDYGTTIFCKRRLGLDPETNFTTTRMLQFLSSVARIFIALPVETVLRRGQVEAGKPDRTVVATGPYSGLFGTLWMIAKEGQAAGGSGLEGMFRGWKVNVWAEALDFCAELLPVGTGEQEF